MTGYSHIQIWPRSKWRFILARSFCLRFTCIFVPFFAGLNIFPLIPLYFLTVNPGKWQEPEAQCNLNQILSRTLSSTKESGPLLGKLSGDGQKPAIHFAGMEYKLPLTQPQQSSVYFPKPKEPGLRCPHCYQHAAFWVPTRIVREALREAFQGFPGPQFQVLPNFSNKPVQGATKHRDQIFHRIYHYQFFILISFLITVTKYLTKRNLVVEGFPLTKGWRVQSIRAWRD